MGGKKPYRKERNQMDHNIKVLLWRMTGYDESYCEGLERHVLQIGNTLWNVIVFDESYWDVRK